MDFNKWVKVSEQEEKEDLEFLKVRHANMDSDIAIEVSYVIFNIPKEGRYFPSIQVKTFITETVEGVSSQEVLFDKLILRALNLTENTGEFVKISPRTIDDAITIVESLGIEYTE